MGRNNPHTTPSHLTPISRNEHDTRRTEIEKYPLQSTLSHTQLLFTFTNCLSIVPHSEVVTQKQNTLQTHIHSLANPLTGSSTHKLSSHTRTLFTQTQRYLDGETNNNNNKHTSCVCLHFTYTYTYTCCTVHTNETKN